MKNLLLLFTICCMAVVSCTKNAPPTVQQPEKKWQITLGEAKMFYAKALQWREQSTGMHPNWHKSITPDWSNFYQDSTDRFLYLEMPAKVKGSVVPVFASKSGTAKSDIQLGLRRTFQTLAIFKSKANKFRHRIITYAPTDEYLQRHNNNISHNRLGKIDKDYEGFIHYSNLFGVHIYSLKFENGKVIRKISNASVAPRKASSELMREICEEVCPDVYQELECTEPSDIDPDRTPDCYWVYVYTNCRTECWEVGDDEDPDPCADPMSPSPGCDPEPLCTIGVDCPGDNDGGGTELPPAEPDGVYGTDCKSFLFRKTGDVNWQEAGLNKIRLQWVWTEENNVHVSVTRTVWVDRVVFGLPYQFFNDIPLSPGKAANISAAALHEAKLDTYEKFRSSALTPSEAAVILEFNKNIAAHMKRRGGTAGKMGTASNQILWQDEIRTTSIANDCD